MAAPFFAAGLVSLILVAVPESWIESLPSFLRLLCGMYLMVG
jgi:hypothetical protein